MPDLVGPFLNPDPMGLLRLVRLIKEAEVHCSDGCMLCKLEPKGEAM